MIDIQDVLASLATRRPIFHSEADFQHALAWRIQQLLPDAHLRLEYRPLPQESLYLDIWVRGAASHVAIELKYPCRKLEVGVGGEVFALKDHAAQDLARYDFVKDLTRLERIVAGCDATNGYAVMLTNDSSYWNASGRGNLVDVAFRLHQDRKLEGSLGWASHASQGTTRGREWLLELTATHSLSWRDYSTLSSGGTYRRFRYLVVPILPKA